MAYNDSCNQEDMVLKPVIFWYHFVRTSLFNRGLVQRNKTELPS